MEAQRQRTAGEAWQFDKEECGQIGESSWESGEQVRLCSPTCYARRCMRTRIVHTRSIHRPPFPQQHPTLSSPPHLVPPISPSPHILISLPAPHPSPHLSLPILPSPRLQHPTAHITQGGAADVTTTAAAVAVGLQVPPHRDRPTHLSLLSASPPPAAPPPPPSRPTHTRAKRGIERERPTPPLPAFTHISSQHLPPNLPSCVHPPYTAAPHPLAVCCF